MAMGVLILGYARHGKDTFAKQLTGVRFSSSSWFAARHFIFERLNSQGWDYSTVQECYNDRRNYRAVWHSLIAEYNENDPTLLARRLLLEYDVYVGMRARREVAACFSSELFEVVYWVDASQRLPPESKSSMDFDLDWVIDCPERKCDLVLIDNNDGEMYERERYVQDN